jgi:predicted nucleic acid-binding protein
MAVRDVFVDTSGLYALVNRRDPHHASPRETVERVLRSGHRLAITDYVMSESATLAKARGGFHLALKALDLVDQSVGIRVEWIQPARFGAAKAFFRRYHDHSFVDCTSFVVMRELKLREALTSDRHFVEAGFSALLA